MLISFEISMLQLDSFFSKTIITSQQFISQISLISFLVIQPHDTKSTIWAVLNTNPSTLQFSCRALGLDIQATELL